MYKSENFVPNICQKVRVYEGATNMQGCVKNFKTVILLQQF